MGSRAQLRDISDAPAGRRPAASPVDVAVDVAVGAVTTAGALAGAVGRRLGGLAEPVANTVLRPRMLAPSYRPGTWLDGLAARGGRRRTELTRELSALLDRLVPAVVAEVVQRLDLTELVRRYVDLDRIVASVNLDAAVARVDIDAVARRLDVDSVVARLDLTRIVRERVDLDYLVSTVDLDAAVGRVDLDAVAARLDYDAVIERIGVVALAERVIAEIDLPEIIRESTGSVASDTVRGVRMQSISADEAVGRGVDRLRLRRGRRPPDAGAASRET
ncbi:MAG: hypothetical protein ACXVXG_10505 [Nocardioidaceae bacterium]